MTDPDRLQCDIRGCVAESSCTVILRGPWEVVTLCERHAGITRPTEEYEDFAVYIAGRNLTLDAQVSAGFVRAECRFCTADPDADYECIDGKPHYFLWDRVPSDNDTPAATRPAPDSEVFGRHIAGGDPE